MFSNHVEYFENLMKICLIYSPFFSKSKLLWCWLNTVTRAIHLHLKSNYLFASKIDLQVSTHILTFQSNKVFNQMSKICLSSIITDRSSIATIKDFTWKLRRSRIHLLCFISNVYKQRLTQPVDILENAKQLNPLKNDP